MSSLDALLTPISSGPVGSWLKPHAYQFIMDGGATGNFIKNTDGKGTMGWTSAPVNTFVIKTGSKSGTDYITTSSTFSNMDGTNLIYTFTPPIGFNMLINALIPSVTNAGTPGIGLYQLYDTYTGSAMLPQGISCYSLGSPGPVLLTQVLVGDGHSHTISLQFNATSGTTDVTNTTTIYPQIIFQMVPTA